MYPPSATASARRGGSAAILAGGQAARFGGRDKSALLVDGRTILETQIATLSPIADDLMIIRAPDDVVPGCGPMGGIHAALLRARHEAVFVVACDMPFITTPLAEYLLSLAADADIVVPKTRRGYHPLCAVYTRGCLDPIDRRLAERQLKMTELFADVRTREVTAEALGRFGESDRLLANVNTPADYAGLEALQGHKL
jgi:molybdopterin-guanine dinucleotide biosynthesis protein A